LQDYYYKTSLQKERHFCGSYEPFSARLPSKFRTSANWRGKNVYLKWTVISKNIDFDADFESIEKVPKRS
jgi:hypothetical protein